jgi:autotransporter-associated beta strand protein
LVGGIWTNDVFTNFTQGSSVLFDLRGSNNTMVNLSESVSPAKVTVHSPTDYIFSGSGSIAGAASLFKAGPGRLTINNSNTYTGGTFVSAGTLLVNGNQSTATGAVSVGANGTLGGTGTIGGNTTINGTLSPGVSIGALTFNGSLTFGTGGNALFEISKSPFANDVARVFGNVNYGGALNVVNTSVELLEAGDNFRLFEAAGYGGTFSSFNLPALEDGLEWNTSRLNVDGRLWVVSTQPPVIGSVSATDGNITFNGTGGTPDWQYYVLTSTNVAWPVSQWMRVGTNAFGPNGEFNFSQAVNPNQLQQFYLLQLP